MTKYYVGIDAHVKFCQFSVIDSEGKELLNVPINTNPADLIKFVKRFKEAKAIIESSSMAEWLMRLLEPDLEEIIVCDPRQNHWISSSDDSDDALDAHKLAQLLRGGFYKPVHVPAAARQLFREIVLDYHRLTRESTRIKNRIKAKYRSRGIAATGQTVYSPTGRDLWLARLDPRRRTGVAVYYNMLNLLEDERKSIIQRLRSESRKYPEISLLSTVPGVGFITAVTFFALVDTPWRFPDKQHLWSYCRLGLKVKTSAGMRKGGGQKGGCRILKSLLMGAALTAIHHSKQGEQFNKAYKRHLARGLSTKVARRAVARSICSKLYGIWKSGQPYRVIEANDT